MSAMDDRFTCGSCGGQLKEDKKTGLAIHHSNRGDGECVNKGGRYR